MAMQIYGQAAQQNTAPVYENRLDIPTPNETVSGVTEESISGMHQLCKELQGIADRITGPQPSPTSAQAGIAPNAPSLKDRVRDLRGLVYQANELMGRIASNLL